MRYFDSSCDFLDIVYVLDRGGESRVDTEELLLDNGPDG